MFPITLAERCKASDNLFFRLNVLLLNIFPPEILLFGERESQAVKFFAVLNFDKSNPTSDIKISKTLRPIAGIAIRSSLTFRLHLLLHYLI